MTALLHTLRDLGVGFLYALAGFYLLVTLYLLYALAAIGVERFDRRHLLRTQDKELQQAMEDWPRPVPFHEDPVDLGAAISGKDFAQYHLDRRAG